MTILWFATQPTTPAEASPATTPATESNAGNDAKVQAIAQELQLLEQLLDAEINRR
jgi:hypothetical protein